jgi:hypothetical protein
MISLVLTTGMIEERNMTKIILHEWTVIEDHCWTWKDEVPVIM